jgi:hypothetical protein
MTEARNARIGDFAPFLSPKETYKEMPVNDESRASRWLNVSCSAGMMNPGMP